jgi:hypothetical protein
MMSWLHQHAGFVRALAMIFFLGLMAAGILVGEYRLFRIESATL